MKVQGKDYRTIWWNQNNDDIINIIDQRYLPHKFIIEELHTVRQVFSAIKDMQVRGAADISKTNCSQSRVGCKQAAAGYFKGKIDK